jgi:hypothetical protein
VSEQLIGVRVFGRASGYNPAEDNLVRVSARSLRTKLKEYFETEGAAEPVRIEIPKGSYLPEFRASGDAPGPAVPSAAPPAAPSPFWKLAASALLATSLLLAVLVWNPFTAPPTAAGEVFARESGPVTIVLTDSSQVLLNAVMERFLDLDEYTSRSFVNPEIDKLASPKDKEHFRTLLSRQITSWADVLLVNRLQTNDRRLGERILVRHARHMQVRDFKSGNFLIVATPASNPWASLFEPNLNFQAHAERLPEGARQWVVNREPRDGERSTYRVSATPRGQQQTPVRIAAVPNLSGNGRVLMVAGLTMEGTEAGVELVSDPKRTAELHRFLGLSNLASPRRWELLLEATSLQGSSKDITLLAKRIVR